MSEPRSLLRRKNRTVLGAALAVLGVALLFAAATIEGEASTIAAPTTTTLATTSTPATGSTITTTTAVTTTAPPAGSTTTTTGAATSDAALVAQGEELFQKTAGGVGCAYCHGADGAGNPELAAPDVRERSGSDIADALITRAQMQFIVLNSTEIDAIAAYIATLP